jgi:hypothetical protein
MNELEKAIQETEALETFREPGMKRIYIEFVPESYAGYYPVITIKAKESDASLIQLESELKEVLDRFSRKEIKNEPKM